MIIKNLTRRQIGGTSALLHYILRYVTNEKQLPGQELKPGRRNDMPFIIRHNVKSRDIEGMIKEFIANDKGRLRTRSNQIALNHTIISFGIGDTEKITDRVLRQIAKQYIQLRSPNSLFCGSKHLDRSHVHIHLAMSSCDLGGRSNRMSRQQFAEIKVALQEYQLKHFPELTNSIVHHGRSKDIQRGKLIPTIDRRNGRMSQKETLLQSLEAAFSNSKSLQQFLESLQQSGYTPYYRGQEKRLTRVQLATGRRFRFEKLGFGEKIAQLNSLKEREDKELQQLREIRSRSNKLELEQEQGMERTLYEPIAMGVRRMNRV